MMMHERMHGKAVMTVSLIGAAALLLSTGCATKKYVRGQMQPIVQNTNELEQQTAANNRNLYNVNKRAQAGIAQAQSSANAASEQANNANQAANAAQQSAQDAVNRADSLSSVVANLDNYKQVGDTTVHFAFNKAILTRRDREKLDSFAQQLSSTKGYILEVTGGTDSTGPAAYNYELSDRRANSVVRYLAAKYNVPLHKFYLIGIGKDDPVASNHTAAGRADNRRVEIQLLSNLSGQEPQSPAAASAETGASQQTGTSNPPQSQQ